MALGETVYSGNSRYRNDNPGPIRNFLNKVSGSWDMTFVWPKIWALQFTPRTITADADGTEYNILKNIYDILGDKYDDINKFISENPDDGSNWIGYTGNEKSILTPYYKMLNMDPKDPISVPTPGAQHFLLANKLTYQEEKMNLANASVIQQLNLGGILEGRAGGNRNMPAESRQLSVTFINTNYDFVEHVIRPWIVAAAYRGFIETKQLPELKCDIHTYYYAKSSPFFYTSPERLPGSDVVAMRGSEDQPFLYQEIIFHDCVPISTPAKGFNYGTDLGTDETMTEVKFSYEYYTVKYNSVVSLSLNDAIVDENEKKPYDGPPVEVSKQQKRLEDTTRTIKSLNRPGTEGDGVMNGGERTA